MTQDLSPEERARYARHLILPEVGLAGQQKLKATSVLCIGAGGLGSPVLLYLAAAGIGRLGIVDGDHVDLSNLQRQVAHSTSSIGSLKVDSARRTIGEVNPYCVVETFPFWLSSANAMHIVADYDIVVDGTDNFATRYLVNDVCVLLGKPNVYGSIFRFEGQSSVFRTPDGPCYRCLFPEPPPPGVVPSCAEAGVLGVLPGMIGLVQATETIKVALGIGQPLVGRLVTYNALEMSWRELKLKKDPQCPLCGENPTITAPIDYARFCGVPEPLKETALAEEQEWIISVTQLKERFDEGERPCLIDVREPEEREIAVIPHAISIPMNEIPQRLEELDKNVEIILHCRSGGRSMRVLEYLREQGYTKLKNLEGGTLAWSSLIDPSVPRY